MKEVQKYQLNMRSLRENAKLTQKQVAEKLGIEQTVYSRYETGRADIKPFQLIKICNYYKVSADYLLDLPEGRPMGNNNLRLKNKKISKFDQLATEVIDIIRWAKDLGHISNDAKDILLENVYTTIEDLQGSKRYE